VAGPHLQEPIQRELADLGCRILVEPMARNTAPCIGFAAAWVAKQDPQGILAILPADHYIQNDAEFLRVFDIAVAQAGRDLIATLGVTPDHPETGYGYVQRGAEIFPEVFQVRQFVEKPDRPTAEKYLEDGNYDWNAGMFFMRANVALEAISRHMPALSAGMTRVMNDLGTPRAQQTIKEAFEGAEPISIDYGVMEKEAQNIVDIPCAAGWSDLGSWRTLLDFREGEPNFVRGSVTLNDVSNSVVVSQGPHIAVIGMEGVAVVATDDAVLVTPLDRAQEVGEVAKSLPAQGLKELV